MVKELYDVKFVDSQQKAFEQIFYGSGFFKRVCLILKYFSEYTKGKVLDLGCGVGTFAILLSQRGYYCVGLDISKYCIEQSIENAKRLNVAANTEFVLGNCGSNVFRKNSFDIIVAADIFEHLPWGVFEKTLVNCFYWLSPGGILIIHTFPTLYYPLLLSKSAFLVLPILFLPSRLILFYLNVIYYYVLDLFYVLVKGVRYREIIAKSGHCNPQNPRYFKKLLKKVGFKIIKYVLLEEPLSELEEDMPRYKFCKRLLKNEIIKPSVFVIAQKPKSRC
ncbi:MAG: class I SAM-dependent methyltransferase [Nitrososphaeria archaeon]